jgi:hypothetical protein
MIDQNSPFNKVGKELPYMVPSEFFDRMPEETLQLAKRRMERRRRGKRVVRFVTSFSAVAAVLVLVLLIPKVKQQDERRAEKIETVLKDMSNDELTKMTVVYGSDMMEEEYSQENTY